MTQQEYSSESFGRATSGQALTNYPAIFHGFIEKGIAESEIKPRENVLTFWAWKAVGRRVKKGEHGVKITTFVTAKGRDGDDSYRFPRGVTVFHITQTEPEPVN